MVIGTGSYASDKVLTNHDLEKMVDTSDEWIKGRTGIERRHILEEGRTNSDQAAEAAKRALKDAGLSAKDIDCIFVGTITPDSSFPSTACQIQAKIGAHNAAAMDVAAACSGFLYGLILADTLIGSGVYKHILVIGSEVLSRFVNWDDRTTAVLFGDGAGAVVLGPSDGEKGLLSRYMKSDGRLGNLLYIPGGGSTCPATHESVDQHLHTIHMAGREVFKHAVRTMVDAALHGLKEANVKPEEIDLLITHQANMRIINAVKHRLKLPDEKVFINLNEYGNTSAASIPIALDQAKREGRLKEGDKLLLVAFGGGFTWAASVIQF
ncbi:ketoacyl-ACP synthase III [candidate division KSB1 bacterium]|nr:ketoacyl-ACP synthase III [candidate division KSB1 bacterium]